MRRALELAERGWGQVAPNPLVGAVAAHGEEVVGEGWHAEWGGDHAEVAALRAAGERAAGATLYVNLEPCAHAGKTPPCTEAIVRAGVRRVAIGCLDPHPEARGGGERLRAAGVEVAVGVEAESARLLNAPFLWWSRTGRPFLTLKLALSLDGAIATRPGERTEISGPRAWEAVHRLRAGHDAVLVGIGTVLADDPVLTPRGVVRPRVPGARVVLDSSLRLPPDSRLVRSTAAGPVWAVAATGVDPDRRRELVARGVRVLELEPPTGGGRPRLETVLATLAGRGLRSILTEGGAAVAAAVLREELAQRLCLVVAPRFLGPGALPAFAGAPACGEGSWRVTDVGMLGEDVWVRLESARLLARLAEE